MPTITNTSQNKIYRTKQNGPFRRSYEHRSRTKHKQKTIYHIGKFTYRKRIKTNF